MIEPIVSRVRRNAPAETSRNQIEPAVEYQFFYLDLTSKVLGRWAETAPYRDDA